VTEADPKTEICVSFRLSRTEFEAAMHRMFWKFWQCSITVYGGALVLVLAAVVAIVDSPGNALPVFLLAGLWFGTGAWLYWVSPRRQYRQRRRTHEEQTLCFSEDACTTRFVDAEVRSQWSLYEEVLETRDAYLLRLEKRAVNIVPKRAFTSSADETRFRSLAQRHAKVKFKLSPITA
jgi:YcxB-like protein